MDNYNETEKISTLKCMGFNEVQARQALSMCNGNVDLAVDRLVSGMVPSISSSNISSSNISSNNANYDDPVARLSSSSIKYPVSMIQAPISQYSLPDGRSACTCIALETASSLLHHLKINTAADIRQLLTANRLQSMLLAGSDFYNSLKRTGCGSSDDDVQHLSPEEVLSFLHENEELNLLKLGNVRLMDGGVRQGILTSGGMGDGPLGLKAVIQGCQSNQEQGQWICVVMTKTPETVCIMLPPPATATATTTIAPKATTSLIGTKPDVIDNDSGSNIEQERERQPFVLIDSHPRPIYGADGSYALFHDSLDGLVHSLEKIFPATELGSDVGELMAAMYNSFDMYPLTNS
jgi:hypothetical protein